MRRVRFGGIAALACAGGLLFALVGGSIAIYGIFNLSSPNDKYGPYELFAYGIRIAVLGSVVFLIAILSVYRCRSNAK